MRLSSEKRRCDVTSFLIGRAFKPNRPLRYVGIDEFVTNFTNEIDFSAGLAKQGEFPRWNRL